MTAHYDVLLGDRQMLRTACPECDGTMRDGTVRDRPLKIWRTNRGHVRWHCKACLNSSERGEISMEMAFTAPLRRAAA